MGEGDVGSILRETIVVALKLSGPPLLAALVIGIAIALLQAMTQINESALAFVPKVLVLCGVLVLLGPFMLATLTDYTHTLFDRLIEVGGS